MSLFKSLMGLVEVAVDVTRHVTKPVADAMRGVAKAAKSDDD